MGGCAGYRINAGNRYEGLENNKVRVYVHLSFNMEKPEVNGQPGMTDEEFLMAMARQRVRILTAAYNSIEKNSIVVDISRGEYIYKKCTEEYCEAFVDFPLM